MSGRCSVNRCYQGFLKHSLAQQDNGHGCTDCHYCSCQPLPLPSLPMKERGLNEERDEWSWRARTRADSISGPRPGERVAVTLRDFLRVARRWWLAVVVASTLAGGASYLITRQMEPVYRPE